MSVPAETQPASLEDRYGKNRSGRFDKRFGYIAGGALVVGGLVFLFFSGWNDTSTVEYRDIAHSMPDDQTVSVTFEVTSPANTPLLCVVEALNTSYATVGWKVIELPESSERTRTVTDSVITTNPATTGLVNHCWIPERA